jgi:hypothetical protein
VFQTEAARISEGFAEAEIVCHFHNFRLFGWQQGWQSFDANLNLSQQG